MVSLPAISRCLSSYKVLVLIQLMSLFFRMSLLVCLVLAKVGIETVLSMNVFFNPFEAFLELKILLVADFWSALENE